MDARKLFEDMAASRRYRFARLYTDAENNDTAIAFYTANGYTGEPYLNPDDPASLLYKTLVFSKPPGDGTPVLWKDRSIHLTEQIKKQRKHRFRGDTDEKEIMIVIQKVDKGTELAKKLLGFVEGFSWLEVREHTVKAIRDWEFEEWESPFAALAGERIVGMATIAKTDYYPMPEISPWISTIFVSEEFRGKRISEKLIDFINRYARGLGFVRTYIPSEHIGLYEKYGYRYLQEIKNYGNGIDRLYVKDIG